MEQYFSIQWHICDTCDQRCKHCYIFNGNNGKPLVEMTWEQLQAVLTNAADMCKRLGRVPYFYITGGDPILHKDFWRLLELLKSKQIDFTLMGNPFHLSDDVCRKMADCGCGKYQLSLDGLRETHDKIRKPGSFDATINAIKYINNAGMTSAIMTTVSGMNIKEIPALIDTVVENKVDVFAFARYCPVGFEKENHIEPLEYRAFLDTCWKKFEQYKDSDTIFNLKDHLWTLYLYEKGLFNIPADLDPKIVYDGCNCGIGHITILPNGDVYACRRMESKIGNVFTESLYDLFLGDNLNEYRQFNKFEKCAKCELLRFCRGCPAVAYGYTNNHFAADPQCWKEIN
jgi:radical SAM/SPASM domain protein of ACGX system